MPPPACCKEQNKPVLDFESFMALPGCTKGSHTSVIPAKPTPPPPSKSDSSPAPSSISKNGVESYGPAPASLTPPVASTSKLAAPASAAAVEPLKEEVDSTDAKVAKDARCKRRGCGAAWKGEDGAGRGALAAEECRYHPGGVSDREQPPIMPQIRQIIRLHL